MRNLILILFAATLILSGCGQEKKAETAALAEGSFIAEHDFTLKDMLGNEFVLSEQSGLIILDFWATWCPPCRAELPVLQQLHEQFKDNGLTIVGISTEPSETIQKFIDEMATNGVNLNYKMVLDPGGKVTQAFGIKNIPSTYIIGKDGELLRHEIGFSPELVDEFHKLIKEQLQ